jgi:hypothetical protein
MIQVPKVFISYSWTSPTHEEWVINLAERLVLDGVDIIIDKWNLREGHDMFDFMESMVKSEDINKVLIILDKKYAEKAERRTGGVGTETQIISAPVYSDVSQEKFIPIIAETDEGGEAYKPTYLKSRIHIDLSKEATFEENYEKLLRNIFHRPSYSKPPLGKAPNYLFEETVMTHKTSIITRGFDNQISKNPKRINSVLREFLEEFFSDLKKYSLSTPSRDYYLLGKEIYDKLNSFMPLRNDFIAFFDKITREEYEFDIDILLRFLEKLPLLKRPLDNRSSWSSAEFEHFKFIIHELFIYLIVVGLKNENYKFLEELFYYKYFFQDQYQYRNEPKPFTEFYNLTEILDDYYKKAFSKNFLSPMADFLMKRIPEGYSAELLVDADLLCCYIAELNGLQWFPLTYIYKDEQRNVQLFHRLSSSRHFEKVKVLFGVTTPEEFKEKLRKLEKNHTSFKDVRYANSHDYVLPLFELISIDKIASAR